MKLGWFVGFGLGMAAGALLLNNCKRARKTVSDVQDTVVRKMEEKTKETCEAARFEEFDHSRGANVNTDTGMNADGYMNADNASGSAYTASSNMDHEFAQDTFN